MFTHGVGSGVYSAWCMDIKISPIFFCVSGFFCNFAD